MLYPWVKDGHKIFRIVLSIQWVLSLAIGFYTNDIMPALLFGIPMVALPLFLSYTQPAAVVSRIAIGIGVQLLTALHIHQAFGLIEVHFQIFVMLAFLVVFRDWRVIAVATLVVAIHHIGFFILQTQGANIFVFEDGHLTFYILVLHALFAITECLVLMYVAKRSLEEGTNAYALSNTVEQVLRQQDSIDLSVNVPSVTTGTRQFADLLAQMKALVGHTRTLTNDVYSASDVIKTAMSELSHTSVKSADEVASVSSASEQIAVSMQMTSERTHLASDITRNASDLTIKSRQALDSSASSVSSLKALLSEAEKTNSELNERCNNISDAMRSITAVADQTNLLALNAAIESARAGEHGRGFAVVADEVRTLAIRSKESADEISFVTEQLVTSTASSVQQMQACIELVDQAVNDSSQAGSTMSEIESQMNTASEHMTEVAAAAEEQEVASQSIAESTAKLHELAQDEAATAVRLEEQVVQLATLCSHMQAAVKKFVI
ncbi:methyl-accepting chemotaxis protein [Alteromonas sp. C1M14]|uniref:methyl-accepting chemotaxis protein n=1 Tax=Alteromonas sp. C1M14 TaxID=2841567 RepID=UPI001C0844E1|nr:methyl-accepting chemotaxis protein [Alteromonas sp. C1M14]MBU2980059.1 methyl-accepting chemotaxis protein [Alteromonas sp. C1M14]